MSSKLPKRILIMGAAGRDFHNFNMVYRDDPGYEVVAFSANQIPDIAGRRYPPALAGQYYPEGIPIIKESQLETFCHQARIDQVVLSYSDLSHTQVMHKASRVLATGADFLLLGPSRTMLKTKVPVIAICAVRTGCGKSQTTRWLARLLRQQGFRIAVMRHPMPYGDLERQAVQRFTSMADLDAADCTIEEREEYEPHLAQGNVIYAGIDYRKIVALAEEEADIILWDGGNNDYAFIKPDLNIVLVDPLRPGHESNHHPGEAVLRMADIILVAKTNSANAEQIRQVTENARKINSTAVIVQGASPVELDAPEQVCCKRVLVVEDGPTITHGGMAYGAGYVAAIRAQAAEVVDPRNSASLEISQLYADYPHIGAVLPATGYHSSQLQALQETINRSTADLVVSATPCDLAALISINKPVVRARYEYADIGTPRLEELINRFIQQQQPDKT